MKKFCETKVKLSTFFIDDYLNMVLYNSHLK